MLMEELVQHFVDTRSYRPSNVNELLDFLQKSYVNGDITIVEYKNIFFELSKLNAEKPAEFFMKTKLFNLYFDLPS